MFCKHSISRWTWFSYQRFFPRLQNFFFFLTLLFYFLDFQLELSHFVLSGWKCRLHVTLAWWARTKSNCMTIYFHTFIVYHWMCYLQETYLARTQDTNDSHGFSHEYLNNRVQQEDFVCSAGSHWWNHPIWMESEKSAILLFYGNA